MEGPGRWNLEVAKYRQEKYPVGRAFDPQTWRQITDADMQLLVANSGRGGAENLGSLVLQWAEMNRSEEFYGELLRHARTIAPQFHDAIHSIASAFMGAASDVDRNQ